MMIWMAMLCPVIGLFILALPRAETGIETAAVTGTYVAAMIAWTWGGYRWMKARSEIVDFADMLEWKKERDRQRGRRS